jgi:hypothetical protein
VSRETTVRMAEAVLCVERGTPCRRRQLSDDLALAATGCGFSLKLAASCVARGPNQFSSTASSDDALDWKVDVARAQARLTYNITERSPPFAWGAKKSRCRSALPSTDRVCSGPVSTMSWATYTRRTKLYSTVHHTLCSPANRLAAVGRGSVHAPLE